MIVASYPRFSEERTYRNEAELVESLKKVIQSVRAVRSSLQIPPEKKLKVVLRPDSGNKAISFYKEEAELMASFMGASEVVVDIDANEDVSKAFPQAGIGYEVFVFVRDAIDVDAELAKLEKEIKKNEDLLAQSNKKLSNENFISHAKPEAIEKEKSKKAEFEDKIAKSKEHMALLKTL